MSTTAEKFHSDEQSEGEYIVNNVTIFDHLLMACLGIAPLVIASIWYYITY